MFVQGYKKIPAIFFIKCIDKQRKLIYNVITR